MSDSGWPSDYLGRTWVDRGMRDTDRFTELVFAPVEPEPLVPHDVVVGVDTGDGPFFTTRYVAWCKTCHSESLSYQSKAPAVAWAVRHRGGAEQ